MPPRPAAPRLVLFALFALALAACTSAPQTPAAPKPSVFLDKSFADASTEAIAANKPIFIFFDGDWAETSADLLTKILPAPECEKLLRTRTLALHIDVTAAAELTKKYHVQDVPLLLLLAPDGSEIDRWTAFESPEAFVRDLTASLDGNTSVERLRASVKPDDFKGRLKLAKKLIATGDFPSALADLTSLYAEPKLKNYGYVWDASRTQIIAEVGKLRKTYLPANDTLLSWRTAHEQLALASPTDSSASRLVSRIDSTLSDDDHLLAFFRKLPPGSGAYKAIKLDCFKLLSKRRAFAQAAELLTADEALAAIHREHYVPLVARGIIYVIAPTKAKMGLRYMDLGTLKKRVFIFGTYAGAGQIDTARKLALAIIDEDKTGQAPTALKSTIKATCGLNADVLLTSLKIPALLTVPPHP